MDSKLVRAGALIVTLFTITILLVVLAGNGAFSSKKVKETAGDVKETVVETEEVLDDTDYSAWMSDETFFDEKKIGDGKYDIQETKSASYKVSTIDKDIRIVILDEKGKLITGRRFSATVSDIGEYSDDDRDGVIYVADVSPGDYSITIDNVMGYSLPEKPIQVTVKTKIEYKAVADISYLIKTEADIDAEKEDTAVNDASEDTTGNSAVKTVEGAVFGIDVSKYNGEIDWAKVKNEGVKFAIIRCGYRGSKTGTIVEDPYFVKNIEGATKAGIPVGIYFFTQAIDEREAIEEASAVMSLIRGHKITYPIFVDSESAGGKGRADELDVPTRSRIVQAFCETIRSGGYKAGVYASKNWFNNRLDISKLSADNVTWLAEYAEKPSYGATYQLWQYSSAGRIPGIEGRVDMNISYLSIEDDAEHKTTSKESNEDGQVESRDM